MNKEKIDNFEPYVEPDLKKEDLTLPLSHRVFADIVHWVTIFVTVMALFVPIFVLANPSNNILNPNAIFGAIFNGATPAEVWALAPGGVFPGAHYYFQYPLMADSYAMITITLGCSVALWALIPTVIIQFVKEKDYFYGTIGAIFAVLVALSMTGVLSVG